jgi:WD40 repeat protein
MRKISKTPYKVLDAPSLQDDYYLNLVDWSHSNVLSVALGSCVYLWSAHTSKVSKLCDLGEDTVTSISWATSGTQISVGTNSGKILIWDAGACKMVREMAGHENRVGTMAWSSTLLASGSRDRNILLQDIRVRGHGTNSAANSTPSTPNRGYNTTTYSNVAAHSPGSRVGVAAPSSPLLAPGMLNLSVAANPIAAGSASRRASEGFAPQTSYISSPGAGGAGVGYAAPYSISMPSGSLLEGDGSDMPPPPARVSRASSARSGNGAPPPIPGSPLPVSTPGSQSNGGPCVVRELSAHKQEVCGLKWSFDEKMLASGGNDNKLYVWDAQHTRGSEPLCKFEDHTAAVKAVAWSPHQAGLLASGGGTADRHIRFWNAQTNLPLHKIDTGSQVRYNTIRNSELGNGATTRFMWRKDTELVGRVVACF